MPSFYRTQTLLSQSFVVAPALPDFANSCPATFRVERQCVNSDSTMCVVGREGLAVLAPAMGRVESFRDFISEERAEG